MMNFKERMETKAGDFLIIKWSRNDYITVYNWIDRVGRYVPTGLTLPLSAKEKYMEGVGEKRKLNQKMIAEEFAKYRAEMIKREEEEASGKYGHGWCYACESYCWGDCGANADRVDVRDILRDEDNRGDC